LFEKLLTTTVAIEKI